MPVFDADNDNFTLTLYNLNYGTNYATQVNENDTQGGTQDDAQEKIIKMIKVNFHPYPLPPYYDSNYILI